MSLEAIKKRIAAHPVTGTPEQMRRAFEALAADEPSAGKPFTKNGVSGCLYGTGRDAIWLHGGGYVFGSSRSHANCASFLARAANMRIWVPDYPLAPEDVWPAPLNAARSLIESFDNPTPVIGDSAGGHLALNLALEVPEHVQSLVLISPNTDRSGLSKTRQANTPRDLMNADADDAALADMAMPEVEKDSTAASPLLARLNGLPPVWITASTQEVLLDDTLLLIRALGRAGVPVTAEIVQDLFHLWILWPDDLPQAAATLQAAARFLTA